MSAESPIHVDNLIEGKEISNLFMSPSFKGNLNYLISKNPDSDYFYEDGFVMYRKFNRKVYKTTFNKSVDLFSTSLGKMGIKRHFILLKMGYFPLIDLHIHPPDPSTSRYSYLKYIPSHQDLIALNSEKKGVKEKTGFDVTPISCIALPVGEENVKMTIFQEQKMTDPHSSLFKLYPKDITCCRSENEIIETLNCYGYKAMILNYKFNSTESQSLKNLQSFEFLIRPSIKNRTNV